MQEVFYVKNPVLKDIVSFVAINGFVPDGAEFVPVMPDGISALVINTGSPYERMQQGDGKCLTVSGSHFVGIKSKFCFVRPNNGMKTVTIRFKPGALPFIMKHTASELADNVIDADLLFGSKARNLEEQLAENNDPEIILQHVEDFLVYNLNRKNGSEVIREKVKLIYRDPVQISISDLKSNNAGYKQLEREFMRYVGISPKLFIDIVKFNNATKLLFKNTSLPFVRVGYGAGYYDQSHFIRSFKKFSGFTPKEYVAQNSIMFLDNQQRIIDQLEQVHR